jgi:uncharacterized membrane protein
MANALFIVGLVITVVGLIMVIAGYFQTPDKPPATGPEGFGEDVAKAVEAVTKLIEKVEKRFQLGLIVMAIGLTLVGVGAFVKATDAKADSKGNPEAAVTAPVMQRTL